MTDIAPEVFQDYADEFLQRTGRVTAALDIDLDRGEFSALDTADGWETYTIRDVCSAAWHANHNDSLDWAQRLEIFAGRLEHLGIAPRGGPPAVFPVWARLRAFAALLGSGQRPSPPGR